MVFSGAETGSESSIYCMLLQRLVNSIFWYFKIQLLLSFLGVMCLSRIRLFIYFFFLCNSRNALREAGLLTSYYTRKQVSCFYFIISFNILF